MGTGVITNVLSLPLLRYKSFKQKPNKSKNKAWLGDEYGDEYLHNNKLFNILSKQKPLFIFILNISKQLNKLYLFWDLNHYNLVKMFPKVL